MWSTAETRDLQRHGRHTEHREIGRRAHTCAQRTLAGSAGRWARPSAVTEGTCRRSGTPAASHCTCSALQCVVLQLSSTALQHGAPRLRPCCAIMSTLQRVVATRRAVLCLDMSLGGAAVGAPRWRPAAGVGGVAGVLDRRQRHALPPHRSRACVRVRVCTRVCARVCARVCVRA